MRLQLITPVPAVTADLDADSRQITGLALPYGAVGRTNAGPVTVRAGAINIPTDLRRVKLFREHGRTVPVGYAVAASETRDGLSMAFRAAGTPDGDTALLEAAEGVRDALSVELDNVTLEAGYVISADLTAVALTSIPAFADARIVASASDAPAPAVTPAPAPAAPAAPAAPNTPDPDVDDDDDETEQDNPVEPNTPEPAGVSLTPAATPPAAVASLPARRPGTGRRQSGARAGLSLDAAMRHVVSMIGDSQDANAINAALTDIVPGADTSNGAFIRPQWVDELWTPVNTRRPYANAVTPGTLTGMKVQGWKWGTKPVVGPYAGNKTAIPSGPVTFGPAEATAVRHAGGWDVDRIFVDLGDSSLLTAILQAAAFDYGMKQEAYISDTLQTEGTPVTAAGFIPGLQAIAAELSKIGAAPSFIGVSSDVWGDYTGMSTADAPWWLTSTSNTASSLNLVEGTSAPGGLSVFVDPNLDPNTIVGGDRRAVTFYEPRGNPFRVQAVNIPNGGVDIGIFGYCAILVNDARGVIVADVTTAP